VRGPARRGAYRIAILREPVGRGGSAEIHDTTLIGRVLSCRPPRNHFELVEAREYVFVVGDIGITPILPMISAVTAGARPWWLYYGGRSLRSMAFVREAMAVGAANVTLWPHDERGLLDLPGILAEVGPDTAVYCCGPEGLLAATEQACAAAGHVDRLHVERFTQDPVAAAKAEYARGRTPHSPWCCAAQGLSCWFPSAGACSTWFAKRCPRSCPTARKATAARARRRSSAGCPSTGTRC